MSQASQRLPEYIIPKHYAIELEPSGNMRDYGGKVTITAQVQKPTKSIILHTKDTTIKTATICVGTQCLLPEKELDKKTETLTLKNIQPIPKGDIEIHIEFIGTITDNLQGIYRSKYEHDGKTKYIITTQCEAPYARMIFPCFDEPDKKATIDLAVKIEKHLKAIANMPQKSESIEHNKKRVQFHTTPKMPTYLFYVGIGGFEFLEDKYNNVKLRVVTTPGKSQKGKFALEYAKKYLEYFEKYAEIQYPLDKLDLIAVPDFSAGAMENWGAIAFRELFLLIDETTSARIKKRAAEIIAHELWHQWSGNLVTMKWWDDLWLNESFANYVAYKAMDHYNPEWNVWEDYLMNEVARGMFKDTLKTTHPIEVAVNSPNEIEEVFDDISYAKGGSVLRMLEAYVGEEQFRLGVSNYLKKHSYANAKAHDLWDAISQATNNKKIKDLMKSWISQPGYPLLSVKQTAKGIEIKQERCNKKTDQLWPIPVSIATDDICYNKLLEKREEFYPMQSKYLKLNHEQYGFYRTKYPKELLHRLGKLISENGMAVPDRWGIHNDIWALCSIGKEQITTYLEFLKYYAEETNFNILAEISTNIHKLDRLYQGEPWWPKVIANIKEQLLPTYKHILNNVGWDEIPQEPFDTTLLRALAVSFCGFAHDIQTITEAQARYARNDVSQNLADAIYHIVARSGNEATFQDMLARYRQAKDVEAQIRLLVGLYQFKQAHILKEALDVSLSEEVRTQNLRYIFANILSNPHARPIIFNWAKNNWSKLEKYQDIHYIFKDILDALIISQVTKKAKDEVKGFLHKLVTRYKRTQANAFEIVDLNIEFIESNRKLLQKYG